MHTSIRFAVAAVGVAVGVFLANEMRKGYRDEKIIKDIRNRHDYTVIGLDIINNTK